MILKILLETSHLSILQHMADGWILRLVEDILAQEQGVYVYTLTDDKSKEYNVVKEVVEHLRDNGLVRAIFVNKQEWMFGLTPRGESSIGLDEE